MIAVDTNVLVHVHRRDSPWHAPAVAALEELAGASSPWAVPWPCLHEFVRVVTASPALRDATSFERALTQVDSWLSIPNLVALSETASHWVTLRKLAAGAQALGTLFYDARIAAICLDHDVDELWTADRDFGRFPALKTRNPLVAKRK